MQRRNWASLSVKIYSWVLILYPLPFRKEYADQLMQTFRDSLRDVDTNRELAQLWWSNLWDLLENAGLERLKQVTGLRWLPESLKFASRFAAFMVSIGFLMWIIWAITVLLLIPWDGSMSPAGTFAGVVNNFFEWKSNTFVLAYMVVGLDLIVFLKIVLSRRYKLGIIFWRFTAIHLLVSVVSAIAAVAGMWGASLIYPNFNVWEGDQSRGVAYVYWGLIIINGLVLFYIKQALSSSFKLWFKHDHVLLPQFKRHSR